MATVTLILIAIIAFLVAISVLVVFHEFGHFWVARRLGVKVLQFSIGFGRKIWGRTAKDGTEYMICAIPLGGYVKMLDEREGEVLPEEKHLAFNQKPVMTRFAIVSAGPIFNFILAFLLYWAMYMVGTTGTLPIVGEVEPNTIASEAGLVRGDEILAVDHRETRNWQQVIRQIMPRLGDKDYLKLEVKQENGAIKTLNLNLNHWEINRENPDLLDSLGMEAFQMPTPPVILKILPDEPAGYAGFLPGDEVINIDGVPVTRWRAFIRVIEKSPNKPLTVEVKRNNQMHTIVFSPREKKGKKGDIIGYAGIMFQVPEITDQYQWVERLDPWHALLSAISKTWEYIALSFKLIGKMLIGDIGLYNLSGPITIAQGAGITAIVGLQYYLNFIALISVSLGVLNLLPIPILDGGHLFYYVIEMLTGKPVPDKIQVFAYKIGLILLILLVSIAFYNDLVRLF